MKTEEEKEERAKLPSPLQSLYDDLWTGQGIELRIKRDDLIHPVISGNKYRKLYFLSQRRKERSYRGILSFGGAYSNHLHALAWYCRAEGLPLTAVIRTAGPLPESPMLHDIKNWGTQVKILSPAQYRRKDTPEFLEKLARGYQGYLIVPEGGSAPESVLGIYQMMEEIDLQYPEADFLVCPVGTGATLAGIVRAKRPEQYALGISALKSSGHYDRLRETWELENYDKWTVAEQWHWGGYGKVPVPLQDFIRNFQMKSGILLDPLYNGKAMYALIRYLKHGLFPRGSRIVFLHTGGTQGWRGITRTGE